MLLYYYCWFLKLYMPEKTNALLFHSVVYFIANNLYCPFLLNCLLLWLIITWRIHKTYIKPPCVLHGTSIKTPSVRLHERTNKCRYRGLQNLHETYIKPPCILHGTSIKPASAGTHHMRKMFKRYWCKSMSNRSQINRKLIVKYALKNVIACVHFDVVFSGQSPLIDVTFGFCSGKFKLLQNYHLV